MEDEEFGTTITGSRWFNAEPEIEEVEVKAFRQEWLCPKEDCSGKMVSNGYSWPMNPPGYHHTCTECQFTAAPRDGQRFPCEVTYPVKEEE